MTPENLSQVIELALHRVADRWRSEQSIDKRRIGEALKEVAYEIDGLMLDRQRASAPT